MSIRNRNKTVHSKHDGGFGSCDAVSNFSRLRVGAMDIAMPKRTRDGAKLSNTDTLESVTEPHVATEKSETARTAMSDFFESRELIAPFLNRRTADALSKTNKAMQAALKEPCRKTLKDSKK